MATLNYQHTIGGKGVGEGLPMRRGSHLYDVEPKQRYPTVLSAGTTHASQFQYTKGVFFRTPHLPITFTISPYVDNHQAGGNFTRKQHFVLKRGQPVMTADKRQPSIGVFVNDAGATIEDRTYVDPAELATNGTITGFYKPDRYQLKDTNNAGSDPDLVITTTEYNNLNTSDTASTPDQDDYKQVTEADPVEPARFVGLTDDEKSGWRAVYEGLEDTNDQIATGGTNLYAQVDDALFQETDLVENVVVDADSYYFQSVAQGQGFLFPSSGGAERTIFYNAVDQEAGVTLPTKGNSQDPVVVKPIDTSDVSASNINNWKNSATHVEALPTRGVMHTDLEQAKSKQHHRFSTGTEPRQIQQTGELSIPFVDLSKLESLITNKTDLVWGGDPSNSDSFNFSNQNKYQTGVKVGLYGVDAQNSADDLSDVNLASLLTNRDNGYANLHHNLAAPFLVATKRPRPQDGVKPDLFANYTLADEARLTSNATKPSGANDNYFGITDSQVISDNQGEVDMRALGLGKHVIGNVTEVYDMPRESLEQLRINPIFQSRITQGQTRNPMNEGHRRLGGTADTAGVDQLVSDFTFMLLGGSNYDYFSKILPKYEDIGQDIANILEDMIIEGAIGRVEIAFNSVGR